MDLPLILRECLHLIDADKNQHQVDDAVLATVLGYISACLPQVRVIVGGDVRTPHLYVLVVTSEAESAGFLRLWHVAEHIGVWSEMFWAAEHQVFQNMGGALIVGSGRPTNFDPVASCFDSPGIAIIVTTSAEGATHDYLEDLHSQAEISVFSTPDLTAGMLYDDRLIAYRKMLASHVEPLYASLSYRKTPLEFVFAPGKVAAPEEPRNPKFLALTYASAAETVRAQLATILYLLQLQENNVDLSTFRGDCVPTRVRRTAQTLLARFQSGYLSLSHQFN